MIHGGDPKAYARVRGLKERDVLDFSVNLNPLGPPKVVEKVWEELRECVIPYPPIGGEGIKDYYETKFGIPRDMVVPGNGSTELIYLIPRALKPNTTLVLEPTYSDYKRASILAGVRVMTYTLDPLTGFDYPGVSSLEGLIRRVDSVWLGRPNNPTGKGISKGEIKYLSKRFPQKLFILDESFVQFTEDWFPETYISGDLPQNIIVIHSLTKFYSLAGIRMGAAIGHRYMVESLLRFKEPWTVNGVADKIAPFLAFEEEYESKTRRFVKGERLRLRGQIVSDPSWDVLESEANYFLLKWKGSKSLDEVMDSLYKNGIFVRDARNFVGLEENYIRIGLRSEEENDLLLSYLKAITGEAHVRPISISGLCA